MNGGIEIQDRQYSFSIVENALMDDPDVTIYDLAVYTALKYFSGQKASEDGMLQCWPSSETISKKAKCSERSTFRALKHLEELGYIVRRQRADGDMKKTTLYIITGEKKVLQKNAQEAVKFCPTGRGVLPDGQRGTAPQADRTRSNELDPLNQKNPPIPPKGGTTLEEQGQVQNLPFEELKLSRKLAERIAAEFPVSDFSALQASVQNWIGLYGAEKTEREALSALQWQIDAPPKRKKKNASQFIGGWLRRSRLRDAPDKKTLDVFDQFWSSWPGIDEGKEGARQEFYRRFGALPDRDAKNKALERLAIQTQRLIDRVENGEDPRFLPRATKFLREADLAG